VTARTLDRRIAIRTADAAIFQALQYVDCSPDIPGRVARELVITVQPWRDRYVIQEDGGAACERLNPVAVVECLHARLFDLSLADEPTAPIIHAASLRKDGRRILLFGSKGAGKTTLTLSLVRAGYEIEGDENVFVVGNDVIARPRALRVKEGSLPLLPELASTISQAPYFTDFRGQRIYNFDPRRCGAPWRIEQGAADVVVLLRPNHGGYSSVRPIPSLALIQDLVAESAFPAAGRGTAVGSIVASMARTRGFDLSLGDHASALRCLDRVLQAIP
jgi:hypothetical protein